MLHLFSSSSHHRYTARLCSPLLFILLFTGAFSAFLTRPATAAEPTPPPILSASVSCASSINFGDTMTCTIGLATEVDSFTFTAESGDVVLVRVGVTAGTMKPLVRLNDPDGTEICKGGTSYAQGAEIEQCRLSQSGTHTITVTDYRATQTGTYNLFLQRLNQPAAATTITLAATTPAPIQAVAEADSYTLTATANDIILLRVGVTAGTMKPLLRVFDPAGTKLCSAGNSYSTGAEIAYCALPQSGTYTILVNDYTAIKSGTYNLYVQRLNNPADPVALTVGTTHPAAIQAVAEADSYSLAANANDVVLLRAGITAGDMNPLVRVFGPDGVVTCTAGNAYGPGIEISRCVLPQSGTYTVLVGDYRGTRTGTYNLYLQSSTTPVDAVHLAFGTTTSANIPAAATADTYTVTASTNDILLLRVGVTAGDMNPAMTVYDPDGVNVCGAANAYGPGIEIEQCLVPRAGRYTILISDHRGVRTGSYNLHVQRLVVPTSNVPVFHGDTMNANIQAAAEADTYTWIAGKNDTIQVRMAVTGGDIRPSVRVYDPDGVRVCTATSPYGDSAEIASCLLPRSGVYAIMATDARVTGTGAYQLSLTCLTTPCGSSNTGQISADGGSVQLGDLHVTFPPDAITQAITVTLGQLSTTSMVLPEDTIALSSFLFQARTTDGQSIGQTELPLTVAISYADTGLTAQDVAEADLQIAALNAATGQWELLSSQVDASSNSVTAQSNQITNLALVGRRTQSDLAKIYLPLLRR